MEFLRFCRTQWDRVAAVLLAIAGAACLLLGWLGLSTKVFPAEQIPYVVSGGLVGLFCLGAAGTLWLSADLQDEWRTFDRVDRHLEALVELRRAETPATPEMQAEAVDNGALGESRSRASQRVP